MPPSCHRRVRPTTGSPDGRRRHRPAAAGLRYAGALRRLPATMTRRSTSTPSSAEMRMTQIRLARGVEEDEVDLDRRRVARR